MKLQTKITRFVMLVTLAAGILLSGCKPQNIVITNTSIERQAEHWVESTCPKNTDGSCKLMGQ